MFVFVLLQLRKVCRNESLSNKYEKWFKVNLIIVIIIIFKLWFYIVMEFSCGTIIFTLWKFGFPRRSVWGIAAMDT